MNGDQAFSHQVTSCALDDWSLVDRLPVFVMRLSPSGQVRHLNRALQACWNVEPASIHGQLVFELPWIAAVEGTLEAWRASIARASEGATATFETAWRTPDGDTLMLSVTIAPCVTDRRRVDSLLATAIDVTATKWAEHEARSNARRLQLVLQHLPPLAMFMIDRQARVTFSAGLALETIRHTADELRQMSIFDVFANYPKLQQLTRRALAGESMSQVVEYRGQLFDARFVPIHDEQDRVAGALGIGLNISDRRLAEDRARQLQNELAHFGRLSTMGQMAAGIAHELNQPLAAIATLAYSARHILSTQEVPDCTETMHLLENIEAQALRAGEIIRRFRQFARKSVSKRAPSELSELVQEVLDMVSPDLRLHGVECRTHCTDRLPAVLVDSIQIRQVLLNLLLNALEATKENNHGRRHISVNIGLCDGQAQVAIRDTGPGIPPEDAERIFEPLYTTKESGLGLGLSISRRIIEAHGGTLEAITDDEGACLRFLLPLQGDEWNEHE